MKTKKLEGFIVGVLVMLIALVAWNVIPGWRWASPHATLSLADAWDVPVNARIPALPCQDNLHPGLFWKTGVDGRCHARSVR